jgi:predicted phosphodiesterase
VKTIIGISDLQVPYQHKRAVAALTKFVKATKPDEVVCVGDEIDMPQISQWTKGTKYEYAGKLHKQRDATMRILEGLRVNHVMRSNHSDRLEKYVSAYAPGLADEPELQLERYMRYADLGITFHRSMYEFAPGWLLAHGDEGGLSQEPGKTALSLAKRTGKSVFCGHTHRAGIQPYTEAYSGKHVRTIYGMEAGCLMELGKASYLKSGGANWQLAFGIFHVDGKHVSPHLVYMRPDGSFTWDKKVWTA